LCALFHTGCVVASRHTNDFDHTKSCDNQESTDWHCQLGAQDLDYAYQGHQGVG